MFNFRPWRGRSPRPAVITKQLTMKKILAGILALISGIGPVVAQDTDNGTQALHEFCPSGVLNPSSPDVAAMRRYGQDFSLDLYQGILGLSIPIYTYTDEDFTIPVALGYSTNGGFRPNISTGPEGLGWSLSVGGVITREIRGIADEEGWTSTDMYTFQDKFTGKLSIENLHASTVYGWASVYDTTCVRSHTVSTAWCDISHGYFVDYVYTGKAGADYLPIWNWNNSPDGVTVLPYGPSYEQSPDIFHFSFMGRSGSFILCPGREILVYGTEDSPRNYQISAQMQADGFHCFEVRTEDNYIYTFGPAGREESYSYNTLGTTNDVTLCCTWKLTAIEAPDGRIVTFTYGEDETTYTCTPTYTHDYVDRVYDSTPGPEDYDEIGMMLYEQSNPTVSLVYSHLLTRIGIPGRAEILFTYGPRLCEQGASSPGRKLQQVVVRSLQSGETVRSALLSYHLTGTASGTPYPASGQGFTLLKDVMIPGTGRYQMTYDSENQAFPSMETYGIDWMGFYNGTSPSLSPSSASSSFCPSITCIAQSSTWHTTMRQGNLAASRMGMLTSIRYPTGGRSDFEYELNDYSEDVVYPREIETAAAGYGIRIAGIINRDADGHLVDKKTFSYKYADGSSSGVQLWRPILYSKYKASTGGYKTIEHETLSTADSYPYSHGRHTEYLRVVETTEGGTGTVGAMNTIHTYISSLDARCKDGLYDWDYTDGFGATGGWEYHITQEPAANIQARLNAMQCIPSRMGGLPLAVVESSVNPSHRSESTSNTYTTYSILSSGMDGREMQYGHFVKYLYNFFTPWLQGIGVTEYAPESDTEIYSRYKYRRQGPDYRLQREEETDSTGDTIVTAYTYLSACPSLLETVKVYRKDGSWSSVLEEGVKRNYVQAEEHEDLYLPYRIDTADPGGNPWSPTWRTESSCSEWSDDGRPLEITDKAGVKTCILWGYGGQYPVLKAVGISFDDLTTAVPAAYGGVFTSALPSAIETAIRSLPDIQVTSWTYRPLVGILTETDPSGRTQSYEYDTAGRLIRIRNAANEPLREFSYYILTDI